MDDRRDELDKLASKNASLRHWVVALLITLVCCGAILYQGYEEYMGYIELQGSYTKMVTQCADNQQRDRGHMISLRDELMTYVDRYKGDSIMIETQREVIRLFKVKYGK